MASPHDILYRFPDLADELIAKYHPESWGNYKFPFVDVQFLIDKTKRLIQQGESIQPHELHGLMCFYSHPGEHEGRKAIFDIYVDFSNDYVIEQASASWQEYKVNKRRYWTLRKNVIRFVVEETRALPRQSHPPFETKTDSERRAWLQQYVRLLEKYSAFMLEMHKKMAKLVGFKDEDEAVGPVLPPREEGWRRRCVECGGFGVGFLQPESIMCTHCQRQTHQRQRHQQVKSSDSSDTESGEVDYGGSRLWWRCGVCTLDNAPSCDACVVCTSPRHTPAPASTEKRPVPSVPPPRHTPAPAAPEKREVPLPRHPNRSLSPTQPIYTTGNTHENTNIESFFEDVFEELSEDLKRKKTLNAALRRQPRTTDTSGDRKHYLLGIIRDGFSKRGEPVPLAIPSMTIEQLERVVKVWKLQE